MHYSYHPAALVEAAGRTNAYGFSKALHDQTVIIGVLASKGFMIRGSLEKDVKTVCLHQKMPLLISFFHEDVDEAYLNYVPEIDELQLVEGTHPGLSEEIATYSAQAIANEWVDLEADEICCRLLIELGEDDDEEADMALIQDLESLIPFDPELRIKLVELIEHHMRDDELPDIYPDEPDDEDDLPE